MRDRIGWVPFSRDANVASARIRCLNPMRVLASRGFPVELFDPSREDRYRAVLFSKRYDAGSYRSAERLKGAGVAVAFDLCDNHFYNPKGLPEWVAAGQDLRRMIALADALVTSTETLADVVRRETGESRPIAVIGDAVESEIDGVRSFGPSRLYHAWRAARLLERVASDQRRRVTPLVWFGNHGSAYADGGGMLDLLKIQPVLERVHRLHPLSLTVISNSRAKFARAIRPWPLPTRYATWHASTFLRLVSAHSVSIIPVVPNPFTLCKSNNRLALSLSLGVPVVADSIPSYAPFRAACVLDDWEAGLDRYRVGTAGRTLDVEAGKVLVGQICSPQRIADQWEQFLGGLAGLRPA